MTRRARKAREPAPAILCDNWTCPAWVSCKHALGRSPEYAAVAVGTSAVDLVHHQVEDGRDSCDYYERDTPRPWLQDYGHAAAAWHAYVAPPA